jgi:predicted N-acetyltransferase YhbS
MPDPQVTVRAETLADYPMIAAVHMRAFGEGYAVGLIVALHRQRPGYDPRLSLVAERGGEVVGHILYSPRTFRMVGADVQGANLSPLGIHPLWQRQGIGGALMEAGDAEVRRLGYALSVILGHPEYYPRFGYHTHVYGASKLTVDAARLADIRLLTAGLLEIRAPAPADMPSLMQIWRAEEDAVDFAVVPDTTPLWWLSPDPRVACTVYVSSGRIAGYTRVSSVDPGNVRFFMAADGQSALLIAAHLTRDGDVTLPLHPNNASGRALAARFGVPELNAWSAGMAQSFHPNPFDDYLALVKRGERPVGRPIWPAEFDV